MVFNFSLSSYKIKTNKVPTWGNLWGTLSSCSSTWQLKFALMLMTTIFPFQCDAKQRMKSPQQPILNSTHKSLNMTLNNSVDHKHSIPQPCNKWETCEATKRKHKPMKCYTDSERCRLLNLVKLCNYVLISCVLLAGLTNGSDTAFGCSSNPCIFGVCIDDLNR